MQSNILIVEDEYVVSLDLKSTLEDLGHKVTGTVARGGRCGGKSPGMPTGFGTDGYSTGR